MLNRKFDPHKEYVAVIYARMSDLKQNERSPDQQIAEIHRTIKRLGLKWKVQQVFRDDGIKGAYIRKRTQFMSMLNGIRSGAINIDLILVDTTERFARSDRLNSIRMELCDQFGVLILTAESNFGDWVAKGCCQPFAPTDPYGHALVHTVPQIRASLRG